MADMILTEGEDAGFLKINDDISELKKRIQLSEGQRKAHYEECDAKKKKNVETIRGLKKEIKELYKELLKPSKHDQVILQTSDKTPKEVYEYLNKPPKVVEQIFDLKIIDLKKKLDLISYEVKRKKERLRSLAEEYQEVIIATHPSTLKKMSSPFNKEMARLENQIHRVNLNLQEAQHLQKKYFTIKDSLIDDRVYFESTLDRLEKDLTKQQSEIKQLQEIKREALELRDVTKGKLAKLEADAVAAGLDREKQLQDLRKLVEDRKMHLERVERSLLPSSRTSAHRDTPLRELEYNPEHETIEKAFAKLKKVTGSNEPEEVSAKFVAQRETKSRLTLLKAKTEKEKRELEIKKSKMESELEAYRFAQVKEKEQNEEDVDRLKNDIEKKQQEVKKITEEYDRDKVKMEDLKDFFYKLCIQIKDVDDTPVPELKNGIEDLEDLVTTVEAKLEVLLELNNNIEEVTGTEASSEEEELDESGIMDDAVYGKEEGEKGSEKGEGDVQDVPTRAFLKRQSQLIVEAKTRKKGYGKISLPKGYK